MQSDNNSFQKAINVAVNPLLLPPRATKFIPKFTLQSQDDWKRSQNDERQTKDDNPQNTHEVPLGQRRRNDTDIYRGLK